MRSTLPPASFACEPPSSLVFRPDVKALPCRSVPPFQSLPRSLAFQTKTLLQSLLLLYAITG